VQTEARYIEVLADVVKYYLEPLRELALEGEPPFTAKRNNFFLFRHELVFSIGCGKYIQQYRILVISGSAISRGAAESNGIPTWILLHRRYPSQIPDCISFVF